MKPGWFAEDYPASRFQMTSDLTNYHAGVLGVVEGIEYKTGIELAIQIESLHISNDELCGYLPPCGAHLAPENVGGCDV
jgi:hypothetical protein